MLAAPLTAIQTPQHAPMMRACQIQHAMSLANTFLVPFLKLCHAEISCEQVKPCRYIQS